MRVRMKTRYANGHRAIEPDQEGDIPDGEAQYLIETGQALPVDADASHATGTAEKLRKATPVPAGTPKASAVKKAAARAGAKAAAAKGGKPRPGGTAGSDVNPPNPNPPNPNPAGNPPDPNPDGGGQEPDGTGAEGDTGA